MDVKLSGFYLLRDLDRLLRDLQPLIHLDRARPLRIDLSSVASIGPTCLAVLLAVLKKIKADGFNAPGSTIIPPDDTFTQADLYRMEFLRVLVGMDPPDGLEPAAQGARPCRHFDDHAGAIAVARDLGEAIAEIIEADPMSRTAMEVLLAELAENVIYHAGTDAGGFAVAQRWRRRPGFELAIVDLGVGIRSSLTKNPAYADIGTDLEAIITAMQPLVTATPDRNSGYGLTFARGVLRGNGGFVHVRSGQAWVYTGFANDVGISDAGFPGTIVTITARTDRPLRQDDGWSEVGVYGDSSND